MTPMFGFGMLVMGFIAIIIATIIAYFIININEKK
jgi:hypothetical protein